jgi:adenylate cyclase
LIAKPHSLAESSMAEDPQTRRLATIVALDVAGYSARTEADEARTTAEVAALRAVIDGIAKAHGGRVFNTAGDGFMLEFGSSLAAVEAAFELAGTCEPKVRVGVHLGDVVMQPNGDMLGHGVNVAARLMARSAPGAALVSGAVRQTIRGPVAERLHSCGIIKLDKMAESIEAFALAAGDLGIGAVKDAPTVTLLARTNSICVLPFVNMSGDTEQEYFSDGISEDIITDLSKVSALFVIARNTAFTFKAKSADVVQVARQLNVSHVLEGSVRKSAGRVRITAQLIDGASGAHIWAERYDRDLNDIFALQDEISQAIVTALKLLPEERRQIERRGTNNLEAYDLYLRGTRPAFTADELLARIAVLEATVKLAPDYANAWGALAHARSNWAFYRPYAERPAIAAAVSAEAEQALALEPHNVAATWAHLNLLPPFGRFIDREALINVMQKQAQPSSRSTYLHSAHLLNVGRVREAIEVAQRAYEMDPLDPAVANWLGMTLQFGGRLTEARRVLESALARWPDSHFVAINLIIVCIFSRDWAAVDALLAPERLVRFPLREYERFGLGFASLVRDSSPESRRRPIERVRERFQITGHADFFELNCAAYGGNLDEAHTIAARARFGPAGNDRDLMGSDAYRPYHLFGIGLLELRRDRRFVRLCARLGLIDYWLTTQRWPDCVDEVASYYDFKAECAAVAAGPPLPPGNEPGLPYGS